jgi:hypothetical protein
VPVVINDFEVLAEPQPETGKAAAESANNAPKPDKPIEPRMIRAALRALEVCALRTWAH